MSVWLPHLITIAGSVIVSWLTFYLRFEKFLSRDTQREKDRLIWRGNVDKLIERVDGRLREHEKYCDGRWNDLMSEVGEMKGRMTREEQR